MLNYFFVERALAEVESGDDFKIVVENWNLLEDYSDKRHSKIYFNISEEKTWLRSWKYI